MTTSDSEPSLAEQREDIRRQMRAQRRRIDEQLSPSVAIRRPYPASMTMRLLIHRPGVLTKLLALIVGARLAGGMATIMLLVPALRTAASRRSPRALAAPKREH